MDDTASNIADITRHFGAVVPSVYLDFLMDYSESEEVREDGLLLYGASDVVERNTTFGVQRYTQEFLAVGDDSGGRLIVIRYRDALAAPFIIDAGAIVPNRPASMLKPLDTSWQEWSAKGYALQ